MSMNPQNVSYVVRPIPSNRGPGEFRQSMAPHPWVHLELPHDPSFGIYNRRLRSLTYEAVSHEEIYWKLRRGVIIANTGELPTEIVGPDAEMLLNRLFTRDISRVRVGRCSYQLACYGDGGTMMDGVLLRFAPDRFWYVQGDGEFYGWIRAHAEGLNVKVFDPLVWVSQIQGPRSLDVLHRVSDSGLPQPFGYFDCAGIRIAGQSVVVSRTGFTNELGWEVYLGPDVDTEAVADAIMDAGQEFGIHTIPAAATNIRRIEAGLAISGADFDSTVTPFAAGLGGLVDLKKSEFIGSASLRKADHQNRTVGLQTGQGIPAQGHGLRLEGKAAGRVLSSAWSPYLKKGIAIVRLDEAGFDMSADYQVECRDGAFRSCRLCKLPMYDEAGNIPRGNLVDIPEMPV